MNTKLFLAFSLMAFSMTYGQEKPVLETEIQAYTQKIDSIVTVEKSKMSAELNAVEQKFQRKEISDAERVSQKRSIAEKYETEINTKIETEKHKMNEITSSAVHDALYNHKKDSLSRRLKVAGNGALITASVNKKSPKDLLKTNELSVSYAFLNLTEDASSFDPFESESQMRIGNSHSFEVQARHRKQLGNFESPFFIQYGLAYRNDTYMPKKPLVVDQDTENFWLENFEGGNVKRSKLRNVYLTFPVEFQWVLNPKYTEYEGTKYLDASKKQFRIGAGVYAGVRLRTIAKIKYHDFDGKFEKYDFMVDNGVNTFLFGGKVSVSYGGLVLFIKKDFTPIFNDNALINSKNGIMIGLDITNLGF